MFELNELCTMSECGKYRYRLSRPPLQQDVENPPAVFCMLNPSTADARKDDQTIRRLRGFSAAWRCQGIVVVNLYAWRATDPRELRKATDPVGWANDSILRETARQNKRIICAWGANAEYARELHVIKLLRDAGATLLCLDRCKDGTPKHPVRLRADLKPIPFEGYP